MRSFNASVGMTNGLARHSQGTVWHQRLRGSCFIYFLTIVPFRIDDSVPIYAVLFLIPESMIEKRRLSPYAGSGDSAFRPEIEWIENPALREQVTNTWVVALERSPLKPEDLETIPFTLLVARCQTTFMEHKRCVVHIARRSAESMLQFMGNTLSIDMDTVIAGAILADVGKLLEYELGPDGKSRQSELGKALRHPFTGVALALVRGSCGCVSRDCFTRG